MYLALAVVHLLGEGLLTMQPRMGLRRYVWQQEPQGLQLESDR